MGKTQCAQPVNLIARAGDTAKTTVTPNSGSSKPYAAYDFAALEGLRVVACFAVICFHSLLYWGTLLDIDQGHKLLNRVAGLRLAIFGNAGVDVFLVLTGFLAAWQLVPALERTAAVATVAKGKAAVLPPSMWPTISSYYRKRVLRVLPAYITAIALVVFTVDHSKEAPAILSRNHDTVFEYCLESLPLNFVLMNNLIGFGGCGVHFWSLAVQLQFYLAFPLMLWWAAPATAGFRRRVTNGTVAIFVATAVLRWGAAHAAGVIMPLPPYAHPDLGPVGADVAVRYYHTLYFTSPARLGNLATGVLLALFLMDKKVQRAVQQQRSARWAIGLICGAVFIACNYLVFSSKPYGPRKEQSLWKYPKAFAALAYHGSPVYCAATAAMVLAVLIHADPISAGFASFLRSAPMKHLAKVSYDVYLLHMLALYWFESGAVRVYGPGATFAAAVAADPVRGYSAILAAACLGGYAAGMVHNRVHACAGALFASSKSKK